MPSPPLAPGRRGAALSACVAVLLCSLASAAWQPTTQDKLFYQLGKNFVVATDVKAGVRAYVVDGGNTPTDVVKAMLALNLVPVCYFSAGSAEAYRPDVAQLPQEAVGKTLDGWPDEKWLDIRHAAVRSLAASRIAMCKEKGFLAVDPDNVDAYTNDSGFPLTADDQLAFNKFLADTAHAQGLAIGLKNDVDQIAGLVGSFDFAINEECWRYNECSLYTPFIAAKKPVYNIEYTGSSTTFKRVICPKAATLGIQTSKNRYSLDSWWLPC